ncbi:MAG: hypothetical protein P4L03_10050 [Terracidiphilus sp.]|nr:hypothetical protein [Terracidiphilus sp.]
MKGTPQTAASLVLLAALGLASVGNLMHRARAWSSALAARGVYLRVEAGLGRRRTVRLEWRAFNRTRCD